MTPEDALDAELDQAYGEGFYRGQVATGGRSCCEHQASCPTRARPSLGRRVLDRIVGGGGRR